MPLGFNPEKPYNSLPPLPPAKDVETKSILRKAASCARAMGELKGIARTIPNQAILIDSLILQEAQSSTEIENIVTTTDAVYQAFSAATTQIDPATKEVLRYREALWHGFNQIKDRPVLSTNLFIECVQILKENQAGIRNTPGTKVVNESTRQIIYTPPEGESVIRDKLAQLEKYIHSDDGVDPLVKLALIHYQFEAIHPFSDGNGRTGRIVNLLYLVLHDLLEYPVLYLSKFIIENKSDYYRLLPEVTMDQAWIPWVEYILTGIEETARFTHDRILSIKSLLDKTIERAREELPTTTYSKELIELLFEQPYTKAKHVVDKGIVQRQAASRYLNALEEINILKSQKVGREVLFLNTALYELLTSN